MFDFFGILKGILIQNEVDRSKQLNIQISPSSTTNTSTTVIAQQTANRSLILPDISDTLTSANFTQTLTNKTISGSNNTLTNIPGGQVDAGSISDAQISASAAIQLTKLAALTANRVLQSDVSGVISASGVTNTTLAFLDATSSIQTQLNSKPTITPSLVDNHVLRADGTTNLQSSNLIVDDSGNVTGPNSITMAGANGMLIGTNSITAENNTSLNLSTNNTAQQIFIDRNLTLGSPAAGVTGTLSIREDQTNGANTVTIQPVASLTADRIFTLPDATTTAVGTDVTQSLTNKTFNDAVTFTQVATPSNPASGKDKLYFKSNDFLYSLTSAGVETQITGLALTNPMTTGGDIIYGGAAGTPTRLANGSLGQTLTSAGGTAAPSWSNAYGALKNVAVTAAYAILTTDQVIFVSGGAFSVTLPTAVGVSGKTYDVIKTDTSLTNIITIATTSSQTIRGAASVTLNTQNEVWRLVSDGSNWQVLDHQAITAPVSYTPTFTAFGTVTSILMSSWREGDSLYTRGHFVSGSPTTAKAKFTLGFNGSSAPSGLAIDTGVIPTGTHASTSGAWGQINQASSNGQMLMSTSDSTTEIFFGMSAGGFVAGETAQANFITANAQGIIVGLFRVPISGWLA